VVAEEAALHVMMKTMIAEEAVVVAAVGALQEMMTMKAADGLVIPGAIQKRQ